MIKVHRMMSYLRAKGAPWDEINQQLADQQKAHLDNGGDYWDMVRDMGFGDPQVLRDRLEYAQQVAKAWDI